GLSISGASALVFLGNNPGRNVDGVAKTLHLAHSSAVRLLEKLQESGFLESHHGADRRCVEYSLTRKGKRVVEQMQIRRQRALATFVKDWTQFEEKKTLEEHLETLLSCASTDVVTCDRICRLCDEGACDLKRCPVEAAFCRLRS
ncbi:hypothetical protein C3E98_044510, partial [Pseudomonas sp. MWU13-2625]